jgi:hypothetical protein
MFRWIYSHLINTIYFIPGFLVIFLLALCAFWYFKVYKADIGDIEEK